MLLMLCCFGVEVTYFTLSAATLDDRSYISVITPCHVLGDDVLDDMYSSSVARVANVSRDVANMSRTGRGLSCRRRGLSRRPAPSRTGCRPARRRRSLSRGVAGVAGHFVCVKTATCTWTPIGASEGGVISMHCYK